MMWTRFTLVFLFGVLAAIKVQSAQEDELCPPQGRLINHFISKYSREFYATEISYTCIAVCCNFKNIN